MIKELEQKSCAQEDDISELKSDTEAVRMNLILANNRQKAQKEKLDNLIKKVEEMANSAGSMPAISTEGGGIDPSQLAGMFVSK